MVNKENNWWPDFCGCGVAIESDHDSPPISRIYRLVRVLRRCPAHAGLDDETLHATLWAETRRRMRALMLLGQVRGGLEAHYQAVYDSNRVLHVVAEGLTVEEKAVWQGFLNTTFGSGTVLVD